MKIGYEKLVGMYDRLKEAKPKKTILCFLTGDRAVFLNDDAVDVATALDDQVCYPGPCIAYETPQSTKGIVLRGAEKKLGPGRIVFVDVEGVRVAKIRIDSGGARRIDEATGRVYLGRNGTGSYWWCPRGRAVYMRHGEHRWLGEYCTASEWQSRKDYNELLEYLPLPA